MSLLRRDQLSRDRFHVRLPFWCWVFGLRKTVHKGLRRGASLHPFTLMSVLGFVSRELGVQIGLHLLNALVEFPADHDPEVLVEQGPMQTLHECVGLRP